MMDGGSGAWTVAQTRGCDGEDGTCLLHILSAIMAEARGNRWSPRWPIRVLLLPSCRMIWDLLPRILGAVPLDVVSRTSTTSASTWFGWFEMALFSGVQPLITDVCNSMHSVPVDTQATSCAHGVGRAWVAPLWMVRRWRWTSLSMTPCKGIAM